jgi:beta-lactamase class A
MDTVQYSNMSSHMKIASGFLFGVTLILLFNVFLGKTPKTPLISPLGSMNTDGLMQHALAGQVAGIMSFVTNPLGYNIHDQNLRPIIEQNIKDKDGEYAVVVESLSPAINEQVYWNDKTPYPAASLYKLYLIAAVYQAIQNGEITEDTVISATVDHLDAVLGGPEFGYEGISGTISQPVSYLLSRVATVSDNYAAIMLAEKVGWDNVRAQAYIIGASSTSIQDPITTTASDTALYFRKLYNKEIVSPEASQKMMDLLSTAQINNRIPDKLPDDLKIAHKTGELSRIRHDAGIVFLEGNPYIIVLMSKDLKGEDTGIETEAQISKDIFDYFSSKTGS